MPFPPPFSIALTGHLTRGDPPPKPHLLLEEQRAKTNELPRLKRTEIGAATSALCFQPPKPLANPVSFDNGRLDLPCLRYTWGISVAARNGRSADPQRKPGTSLCKPNSVWETSFPQVPWGVIKFLCLHFLQGKKKSGGGGNKSDLPHQSAVRRNN